MVQCIRMTPVPEPRSPGRHLSTAHPCPLARRRQMKRMFATVVVVFAIAGCATGQGVATGAATSATAAPTPTTSPPGPTPSPSRSPSPVPLRPCFPNGPLAAGSYTIQPFVGPGGLCMGQAGCMEAGAEDDSIRITVTVPDGWTGLETRHRSLRRELLATRRRGFALHARRLVVHRLAALCGDPDRTSRPDRPSRPARPSMSS